MSEIDDDPTMKIDLSELEKMAPQETFQFSAKSMARLEECHPHLQDIAIELIREMNVTVLCGHRNEKDQNSAFIAGKSKLQWPRSKHNKMPSHAIDLAPYPIDWNDIERFEKMCDTIELIAQRLNIPIRMGRDFGFKDYPHVELVFPGDKNARG